jgi:hypothetical protein
MSKTSSTLSKDFNRVTVGKFGGSKVSDLNNSGSNRLDPVADRDDDGTPDRRVSVELSERMDMPGNKCFPNKGRK